MRQFFARRRDGTRWPVFNILYFIAQESCEINGPIFGPINFELKSGQKSDGTARELYRRIRPSIKRIVDDKYRKRTNPLVARPEEERAHARVRVHVHVRVNYVFCQDRKGTSAPSFHKGRQRQSAAMETCYGQEQSTRDERSLIVLCGSGG